MIITTSIFREKNPKISNINSKIKRLCDAGKLHPLVAHSGIYEDNSNLPGECLSMIIRSPSYLSFEYALSYHGLIPEAVYTYTSATFKKRKAKVITNYFGTYTYRDVPSAAFPFEVEQYDKAGYAVRIASAEKALCDKLYTISPCKNMKELEYLLFEDLRIDRQSFQQLRMQLLIQLTEKYKTKNHTLLRNYIRRQFIHEQNPGTDAERL